MKGYKICRVFEDKYYSAFNTYLEYSINNITTPLFSNGPLAVFSNYHDAERFYDAECDPCSHSLFECEYEKSTFNILWTRYGNCKSEKLPMGTDFAKSVRLVKRFL